MKKLVLTSVALLTGAFLAHSQGFITMQQQVKGLVVTNGTSIGEGTGNTTATASQFYYEVIDMTQASYLGLSGAQTTAADTLLASGGNTAVSLWTDTGVSGLNQASALSAGGVTGQGGSSGATAANWAAPTANTGYNTAANYDYYLIVGWSANEGTTWSTVSAELNSGVWNVTGAGSWFGQTGVAYNYAGNPTVSENSVNVWGTSAATQLTGSGEPAGNPVLTLTPINFAPTPEPTTLALAGLGGISMLFLRRRKA